jgi:hypothetical protein
MVLKMNTWKRLKVKRIKHNDLTHYFMTPHEHLPASYLASCEKFFKAGREDAAMYKRQIEEHKQQASSNKHQAPSCKLDGWPDSCYSRIIKEK